MARLCDAPCVLVARVHLALLALVVVPGRVAGHLDVPRPGDHGDGARLGELGVDGQGRLRHALRQPRTEVGLEARGQGVVGEGNSVGELVSALDEDIDLD